MVFLSCRSYEQAGHGRMAEEALQREEVAAPLAVMRMLRRRIGVVLICALLVPAAALAFSLPQENHYSAAASLLLRDPQRDQKFSGAPVFPPSNDPAREAATNAKLASLEVVAARTSKALGGPSRPARTPAQKPRAPP